MSLASKHIIASLNRKTVVNIIISSYPLSTIMMILTSGDLSYVRVIQILWFTTSIFMLIFVNGEIYKPSKTVLALSFILVINFSATFVDTILQQNSISTDAIPKYLMIIGTWILFDQLRSLKFSDVLHLMAPSAKLIIIASSIHLMFFSEPEFGRHLFFSMHSNVGGEIIFASLCCILVSSKHREVLLFVFLTFFILYNLQSRSALLGCMFLIASYYLTTIRKSASIKYLFIALYLCMMFIIASIMFNVISFDRTILAILNSVFLFDDVHRGINSGFSGRVETWYYAISVFLSNPIFGVGMDNAQTGGGTLIHGAPFIFLAEFGLISLAIVAIIFIAVLKTIRRDIFRFYVIICSFTLLAFQARTFGLNIFPMLFWLAILPWSSPNNNDYD